MMKLDKIERVGGFSFFFFTPHPPLLLAQLTVLLGVVVPFKAFFVSLFSLKNKVERWSFSGEGGDWVHTHVGQPEEVLGGREKG